jgi:hypothetical protein
MMKIGRLNSTYLIPDGDDFPRATSERLDAVAGRLLPNALARALNAAAAARDDQSIWVFRRLRFDVDLNPDRDDDSLAALWAHRLIDAVNRRIDDPADDDVVHFQDQVDFLHAYIADAAAGRPRKWYHNRFEGLDHLSTTARIRTALCLHVDTGLQTLLRATAPNLRAIVAALSENDARRILDTLSPALPESPEPFRALLDAWRDHGSPAPDSAGEFRWVLQLTIAARSRMSCARPIGRLIRVLRDVDSATCGRVLDFIAKDRGDEVRENMTLEDFVVIEPLLGTPSGLIEPFLATPAQPSETPERRYTPFGAVFFFLPLLDALPVRDPLLRFWILLKVLGASRAVRTFEDPVLRSLFNVDPALSAESFRRWQSSHRIRSLRRLRRTCLTSDLMRDNSRHRAPADRAYLRLPRLLSSNRDQWLEDPALLVARSLSWRLPGFSTSSLPHLYENFLDFPASIEEHESRRVVRLGAPPLQVILNMTGICRWQYTISWLGSKRIELYPEAP